MCRRFDRHAAARSVLLTFPIGRRHLDDRLGHRALLPRFRSLHRYGEALEFGDERGVELRLALAPARAAPPDPPEAARARGRPPRKRSQLLTGDDLRVRTISSGRNHRAVTRRGIEFRSIRVGGGIRRVHGGAVAAAHASSTTGRRHLSVEVATKSCVSKSCRHLDFWHRVHRVFRCKRRISGQIEIISVTL